MANGNMAASSVGVKRVMAKASMNGSWRHIWAWRRGVSGVSGGWRASTHYGGMVMPGVLLWRRQKAFMALKKRKAA